MNDDNRAFALRLKEACDHCEECPRAHGRMTWLQRQLKLEGHEISLEAVRKWFHGFVRPRSDTSKAVAKILGVDPAALFMGAASFSEQAERFSKIEGTLNNVDNVLSIGIRNDLVVKITGLPLDLTPSEAKKLANIILAHTRDDPR